MTNSQTFSQVDVLSQGAHVLMANDEWCWYNTVGSTACFCKLSKVNGSRLSHKNKSNLMTLNVESLPRLVEAGSIFVTVGNVPS